MILYQNTLYIPDIFQSVVDSMKDTYAITGFTSVAGGYYKVSTSDTKNLSNNDYVTISGTTNFNGQYRISSLVADKSFNIEKTGTYASETGTWTANKPYFLPGHLVEITNILTEKDKSDNYKYQKYPLIVLLHDISEQKGKLSNIYSEINVRMLICILTKPEYKSDGRLTNSFKAVLQPIYDLLIQKLMASTYFSIDRMEGIPHTKTDRYFWGMDNNTTNVFNDYIDAIDIENMNLKIKKQFNTCN